MALSTTASAPPPIALPGLIDIGVNLTSKRFAKDVEVVIDRAVEEGVFPMVLTGTSTQGSEEASLLATEFPGVLYSTAGVHPHEAATWSNDARDSIVSLLKHEHVVAVGECGLDFNRNFSPKTDQLHCFESQLIIAAEHDYPVFLHERDAHKEFIEILSVHRKHLPAAAVHCFTGGRDILESYLQLDCYIGVTGWVCDKKRGEELRSILPHIPGDRLLIETDAPYLTPQNMPARPKGGRNEPAFLPYVLQKISETLQQPYDTLAQKSTENAIRFFALPGTPSEPHSPGVP